MQGCNVCSEFGQTSMNPDNLVSFGPTNGLNLFENPEF